MPGRKGYILQPKLSVMKKCNTVINKRKGTKKDPAINTSAVLFLPPGKKNEYYYYCQPVVILLKML
jgi:hypothetical protein